MRKLAPAVVVVLALSAVPAFAHLQTAFPRQRIGTSILATSGGGVVNGDAYATRTAVIAWNRKFNSLTLYLLWRRNVTCGTLLRAVQLPGHLIQVHVTSKPKVYVGRPMAGPEVAFLTIYTKKPEHVAGLKHGAQLTFTSVNSFPGGVFRGRFKVPTRIYGDGRLYGYNGTFAAKFCTLSS